jgi:hypothetical protein
MKGHDLKLTFNGVYKSKINTSFKNLINVKLCTLINILILNHNIK